MNTQNTTPESETFLANLSANQSKAKLREAAVLTRSNIGTCGKRRKFTYALTFMALALVLLAGAAFAPSGFWASLGAVLAMASFIVAVYFGIAFDHGQLKQTALYLAQVEDKLAARASAEESQNLAAIQTAKIEAAVSQQASELLLSGESLETVKKYYAEALEKVRADRQIFQTRSVNANKAIDAADREVREATARFEDRARRWWPGRLVPSYTRTAASQWLTALEKRASARFDFAACNAGIHAYENLAASLARLTGECATAQTETTAAAVDAAAKIDSAKSLENITGCNKQFPVAAELAQAVEDQVRLDAESIRHAIASRPADQSLAEAIRQQAISVTARVQLPKTFGEFFGGLNGSKALLLKQIDLQSSEFAIANPYAGRQRIRHRFLLVDGGEMSPVAKEIKAMSKDMLVRTASHPRPDEFICVTEERFSPIGESDEVIEGFRQFHNTPAEKRGSMIVAVQESPEFLVAYSPESAHDPSRPARLLFVALVLGLIQRTGAEGYKVVDQNDPEAPCFAKGIDPALHELSTSEVLGHRVEQSIENLYSIEGADAIRKKLIDAKAKNLVPSGATKRFRETLTQELLRLDSARPALAA